MRKLISGLSGALAVAATLATAAPTGAAPILVRHAQAGQTDVINVHDNWRRHRGGHFRGNYGWHNGYRGYRTYRPGFRSYNGFWFPGGAFIVGALIGNALADSEPYYGERYYRRDYSGGSHVDWCYDRYRSYREWDNSFQPYHGPRQQCYSPYD